MKNLILFASLFIFLFSACSDENDIDKLSNSDSKIESRGCDYCDIDHFTYTHDECHDCCITYVIDMPNANFDYSTFEFWFNGDFHLYIDPNVQNTFEVCYDDEDGRDEIFLAFYDENYDCICEWNQSIFYEPCEITGESHLCWEDFIGYFECASSITVQLPMSNVKLPIPFIDLDAAWCAANPDRPCASCPCSEEVPVVGGYCCILNQIYAALESTGHPFELEMTDPSEEIGCWKGNDPLPGFFIKSNVQIHSINGTDCNGNESGDSADFISSGHCFPQ